MTRREIAIDYFKQAAKYDYVYAYNNLGKIEETKNNLEKAFYYYEKSANLNESWACNKLGELYRLGIGTNKDLKKSFYYYSTQKPPRQRNYHIFRGSFFQKYRYNISKCYFSLIEHHERSDFLAWS